MFSVFNIKYKLFNTNINCNVFIPRRICWFMREFTKLFHNIIEISLQMVMTFKSSTSIWRYNSGLFVNKIVSPLLLLCLLYSVYLHQLSWKFWDSWTLKKLSHAVDKQAVISLALASIGKWMHNFTCLTKLRNLQLC